MRTPIVTLLAFALAGGLLGPVGAARALTGTDLSTRFLIDGITDEWAADESLFQLNDDDPANAVPEEAVSDSKWGFYNDINQVRLTWDANFLYVAVDAIIWDNNTVLLFDTKPGGFREMTNLNSWRRNFVFQGIEPDLFLATWDNNTKPQLWRAEKPAENIITNTVERIGETTLATVASFAQGNQGRAMEAAIPWSFVLGDSAVRAYSVDHGDTVYTLPADFTDLRVVCVLTAGADGTGGPDSAPDNLSGHLNDSGAQVTIDNWITIPLDLDGDSVVDFGESIRERETFRVRPPIRGVRLELAGIRFTKPIISPEQGGALEFQVALTPQIPPDQSYRGVSLTAEIYDLAGERVRSLYQEHVRPAASPYDPSVDRWNGRDEDGRIVDGGIYVLRVVVEPNVSRMTKAFSVVR